MSLSLIIPFVQAYFQLSDLAESCVMVYVKATVIDRSIFVVVSHSGWICRFTLSLSFAFDPDNEWMRRDGAESPFRFPFLLPFFDFAFFVFAAAARPFRPRKEAAALTWCEMSQTSDADKSFCLRICLHCGLWNPLVYSVFSDAFPDSRHQQWS